MSDKFNLNAFRELVLPSRSPSAWEICREPIFPSDEYYVSISKAISTFLVDAHTKTSPTMTAVEPNSGDQLVSNMHFNVDVIETTYDSHSSINTLFPAKHDREENGVWTDSEREKAALGIPAQSVSDLRTLVGAVLIFRVIFR